MDEIQLLDFQKNVYDIVKSVKNSHKPVMICDEGKSLVKIIPISYTEQESWLGSMRDRGKISGDIISPVEDATASSCPSKFRFDSLVDLGEAYLELCHMSSEKYLVI